jgi:hypothetical protein
MTYPHETNGLVNGQAYHDNHYANHVGNIDWADPRLAKVTRLRLLTDPGFPAWDVSYCHGVLKDGRNCEVELPFSQLPKRGMGRAIITAAIRDGVHAKRLGIFNAISKLW